jgi:hypothetical protein
MGYFCRFRRLSGRMEKGCRMAHPGDHRRFAPGVSIKINLKGWMLMIRLELRVGGYF